MQTKFYYYETKEKLVGRILMLSFVANMSVRTMNLTLLLLCCGYCCQCVVQSESVSHVLIIRWFCDE